MPDIISDSISTTGRVTVGNSLTGEIETTNDSDAFAVELVAGRTYRIDLEGAATDKGTLADPFLRWLRDSSGNGLHGTRDYDGGEGLNPRQVFTPQVSGTYYITASGQGDSVGTYTLTVTEILQTVSELAGEDFSTNISTAGRIVVDDTATGNIGTRGDRDWFAVELVADREYQIDLRGSPTGDGALSDPYLRGIHDAEGTLISGTTNDDVGRADYNSRVTFTASETGAYYIAAGAFSGRLGTYELEVTDTSTVTELQQSGPQAGQAPVFSQPSYAFDLAENADGALFGIAVAPVVATDPDNHTITYSIVGGDPDGLFVIDAGTGLVVYVGAGEDYESGTTSYELTVRASDGGLHSDVTVTVNVTDVEEYVILEQGTNEAPQFAYASYAFSLAENVDGSTTGVALGAVAATDPENSPITYSIVGGDPGGLFAMAPGTGELSYQGSGEDYESGTTSHELTVRARDGALHNDVSVTVNVTDVAEAPAFAETSYTFDLAENAGGDTIPLSLGLVQATDPENSPITYSIELGDPGGLFAIDPGTGALSYRGAGEDYESGTRSHELTVRASDGTAHSDVTVTINVTDDPDDTDEEELVSLQQGTDVSEPDGTDFPATTSTTGAVTVGGSVTGKIETSGDRDWFAVTLEAGKVYRIDLEGSPTGAGSLWDPYLRGIYDANGNRISGTTDDDGGEGLNSRMTFTPSSSATYYVAAGAFDNVFGHRTGTYTLSVTDITDRVTDDFASQTGTAGAVAVGGSATGGINFSGDRDWFAVTLEAGKNYRIDLEGWRTGAGTLFDPILYGIHDEDGNLIAGTTNDNGGVGYNSRVYFTPEENATYYVAAGAYRTGQGTYTLSVTDIADDYEAGTGTDGAVAVGGSSTGEIEFPHDDRDWFAVTLAAGKTYRIDLEGSPTDAGTLFDPYLRGIHDVNGDLIAGTTNDDGGVDRNSNVFFTATADAIYYVTAGADGNRIGTYTLSVTEIPDDYAAGTDTAGTASVGGSSTGEIEYRDDRDWFAVTLEADKVYRIDLEGSRTEAGTLYDPYLRGVYDADGDRISGTTNDDGGAYYNSRMDFTATENATYYVAAGADGNRTGTYTLSVTDITESVPDDFVAGTGTLGAVSVGGSSTGDIEYEDDRDWFAVTLAAGKTYRIDLEGSPTGAGTLYDPYLRGIHDANGNRISGTTDDDDGVGRNSRVDFTATEDATHYVAAGAHGDGEGAYTLSVTEIADDYAAGTETSGAVAVGGSTTGDIEYEDDRDWFAVTLEAGQTYRIDLEGSSTGAGTLGDPYLRGVYDANGDLINGTANDNGGTGYNSRVEFTATEDATYYAAASGLRSAEGTYTLSVTNITGGINAVPEVSFSEPEDSDLPATTSTVGAVAVGGSATGDIERPYDRDWFAVTLEAGKTYRIDLEGSPTYAGTLWNPYLRGVYTADGGLIPGTTNDNGGVGYNSREDFTATENATYYVAADSTWGQTGTYTLSVEEVM